ncbi:bifunctional protein-serine/threonine kinase/phosphatase [Acidisoma cladoniae]|uniref:bifunctional protein-serine/threonine kinase/phosphatase n=1 Tax=Acidisoma cladoniae TaxID=3040935 RepID=UPI00254C3EA4|nr:bifunctional protein-serine/threonine kinase/phosphatase [Acidisoma sp. PAMC 29798]
MDPSALHFDPGRLEVRIGLATVPGPRADNQDFALAYLGTQTTRASHGVVAAVADGVSSTTGGRVAAELAVRGFIDGFLAQKETLAVPQAAAIALTAIADWIESQGQRDANLAGMATTLTALVLRGRRAYGIHIGDSRLYRLTQGQLTQLTTDHHLNARVLSRAVGIEGGSRADYCSEPAAAGDRFLLTSDGVHSALSATRIGAILKRRAAPDETAEMLVTSALEAGGRDNATAMVVDVVDIPAADRADLAADMARLPIGSLPAPGETVDQFDLGPILADGEMSRLFRATDRQSGRAVIVKFPNPELASAPHLRAAFLREAWITTRLHGPWLGEAPEPDPGRQTRLYAVIAFHEGETLDQRLQRRPRVGLEEGIAIGERLAKATAVLHRAGIIHRDIKPGNVFLAPSGAARLIDFGLARVPGIEEEAAAGDPGGVPGTPSYMAPELFSGTTRGDAKTDVYALGVTLYRMFSGGPYPYGEVRAFAPPRATNPVPLTRHRPDLPAWLDATILKAAALNRDERFDDAIDLVLALEAGESFRPIHARPALYDRNPLLFWKTVSAILAFIILCLLVWQH